MVIDTSAFITILFDEPDADYFETALEWCDLESDTRVQRRASAREIRV